MCLELGRGFAEHVVLHEVYSLKMRRREELFGHGCHTIDPHTLE